MTAEVKRQLLMWDRYKSGQQYFAVDTVAILRKEVARLEKEVEKFMSSTVDLRAFLQNGDSVTVHREGKPGSITFRMDEFYEYFGRHDDR